MRVIELWNMTAEFVLGDIQWPVGRSPERSALADSALSSGDGLNDLEIPSNLYYTWPHGSVPKWDFETEYKQHG